MHRTTDIQQTIETKEYTIPIRIYSTPQYPQLHR